VKSEESNGRVKKEGMICLEGNTHRLADVGNRVHTRNDSDEDVRGNVCKKAIAWKALPWSFITQANKCKVNVNYK